MIWGQIVENVCNMHKEAKPIAQIQKCLYEHLYLSKYKSYDNKIW